MKNLFKCGNGVRFKNFGELGTAVRALVDNYSAKSKLNSNVQSLEDMKQFVKNYPEFKKLSGSVTKHMAIMTELQAQVENQIQKRNFYIWES